MAAPTSASLTCTMRSAPFRMISSASGSGTRTAMPSAMVLALLVATTLRAAKERA